MKKTIIEAIAKGKRVYVVYTDGIYKGQIDRIANDYQYNRCKSYGNFKLHNITTDEETLAKMITKG